METILCFSACVLICGMIAFMAFNIWMEEFMKYKGLQPQQIKRPKSKILKSYKEAVENNDETCYGTVSFVTPLVILQKLIIGRFPCPILCVPHEPTDKRNVTAHCFVIPP